MTFFPPTPLFIDDLKHSCLPLKSCVQVVMATQLETGAL